jgi:long-chain acyl-CoA synthetase
MHNYYECFAEAARRSAGQPAIEVQRRDRVDAYDYATLYRMAERIAASLLEDGLAAGLCCTILGDNDERWCAAYLALLRIGAIAVPLDTSYRPSQLRTVTADCRATLALASPRYLAGLQEACAGLPGGPRIVLLSGTSADLRSLDTILEGPLPTGLTPCPAQLEDTAVILYTSGTTSDPKGVMLSHRNLLAERGAALEIVDLGARDSILGVLPLFHALAQIANLLLPLSVGARVVFLETLSTGEILRGLAERNVTAFCCVPQFYYLIYQRVTQRLAESAWPLRMLARTLMRVNGWLRQAFRVNLGTVFFKKVHRALGPRMRILVSGGSRLDPGVGLALYRLGFNLIQAYGLTECSGAATVTRQGDAHLESVGQPMSGVDIRILPHDEGSGEREVQDGEVLIRGPIVMKGYYNRPDADAETLKDGWLYSGDLGYLDRSGRLRITGRKKEVIVLASGKNIYPEEVEACYSQSPIIKDICVIGVARPDEPASERLHAIVVPDEEVLRERKVVNMRDLLRFEIEGISIKLPPHKRVLSFDVWQQDLPRTTTRKLKRFEIERMYHTRMTETAAGPSAQVLSEADHLWASDPVVTKALELVKAAATPGSAVGPNANLDLDLGFDSMERVELLTSLELQFGTDVPDEVAQQIHTVRELVEAVRPRAGVEGDAAAGSADPWERLLAQDPDDPLLQGVLSRRPLFFLLAWAAMKMIGLAARVLIGSSASGREHIPADGPFLISPNHQSYLDAFLVVSALPLRTFRQLFFVGATEYFETPFMRRLAWLLNVVPVDPDANLVRAMQAGAGGLRHGKVLVLFPEGERSPDGTVKKFKKGAAILATQLGVPIVPVAIEGAYEAWPRNRPPNWRALLPGGRTTVHVKFGSPVAPDIVEGDRPEDRYAPLTERLRSAVETMWIALRKNRLGDSKR